MTNEATTQTAVRPASRMRAVLRWRALKHRNLAALSLVLTVLPFAVLLALAGGLLARAMPILFAHSPLDLLGGTAWQPQRGLFGFYPFIAGTAWVTSLAMIVAVPPSLLIAIYLVEYAGPLLRGVMKPFLDVLAGIPSVVYGVWGVLVIVPLVQRFLGPTLNRLFGAIPVFHSDNVTGYSILAGGLVLAVMVIPGIVAVTYEVLHAVPDGLREAVMAMGVTRWQAIKHVTLRRAAPGIIAAVVLGFSRAFGETMAVLMVVGNVAKVPRSLLDPAYPLPALIANNYGEMLSIPLYDAALLTAALILFAGVLLFNLASAAILARIRKGATQ